MEKKLIDAYDHMTMPDDCASRIENRLQAELQNRKPGRYTKMISPYASRRSGWTAAAVCTMLILFMGGAALRLWLTNAVVDVPSEKTEAYDSAGHIPSDRVEAFTEADRNMRVPEEFREILSGEPVIFYGSREKLTAQEYCMEIWGDATANAFTLADMDRDGVCELIFSVQDADGVLLGYLVVRPDGAGIYGYTLRGRDLRKDGTYYSYTAKENSRLRFQDELSFFVESADFNQQDKPLAQWHVYPCQYPQLVLETYRYASETGFSTHPGVILYSYFGTLVSKEADWSSVQPWLAEQSVYIEEKGSFYAFDPDAPGCLMYGTLIGTGEQQKLTALGYYICDETGEYRAEAFDLETSNPIYTVDPPPNDRGREVGSAEAMQDYFGVDFYGSAVSQDVQQIAELLDKFVYRYSVHDTKGMGECMAEDAWELSSYPFTGEVSILSYGILPDAAVNVGESWHTSVELLESGDTKTYYHLSVALAKQPDGWKIHSYSLEEQ